MTTSSSTEPTFELARDAINMLFPLHVAISHSGEIQSVGPTIARIFETSLEERNFFDVFKIEKPRQISSYESLQRRIGNKLIISALPDGKDPIGFRGVTTTLGGQGERLLIDLSFGADMAKAVKRFNLASGDFKLNDFSVDMLYALETQHTLLEDTQKLADALHSAKDEAERKAYVDLVTGIANRRALHARLDELLHGKNKPRTFALFHIDLDKFKSVNDTFGHAAGDAILQHTAKSLQSAASQGDLPARIGGDEFALVVENPGDDMALLEKAEDLRRRITTQISHKGNTFGVGACIGIVRGQTDCETNSDKLLMHSDIALYSAKDIGNTVTLLTPEMVRQREARTELIAEIETGISNHQFVPFFQPQVCTRSGEILGVEVLARWSHPSRGLLSPAHFIEIASRANLLDDIDAQVRRKAMQGFAGWKRQGRQVGKISFNTTGANLRSPGYVETLLDELLLEGLSPQSVQLELLESIVFDNQDHFLLTQCHALKEAGFCLALDDFGTGHSSIAALLDVPVSILKIDRSFVMGLDRNKKIQKITGSVLAMAKQIGLEVLAEGVETRAELDILKAGGCHLFQGFYFSPPLDAPNTEQWIEDWLASSSPAEFVG